MGHPDFCLSQDYPFLIVDVLEGEGTADGFKRALRLLSAYFSVQTSELPALAEYLRL